MCSLLSPLLLGVHSVPLSLYSLFKLLFSFFSTYAGQDILDVLADTLCPTFFPPGQECTLPLNPGEYGSLVGGPLDFTLPDIPDILCKYSGVPSNVLSSTPFLEKSFFIFYFFLADPPSNFLEVCLKFVPIK
jgi:hypothetical protein